MAFSRANALWRFLKPQAEELSVRPQIDVIDLQLRTRMKELESDLDTAKTRIQQLNDTKADLLHTHGQNQITGLLNILNNMQARIVALEAKVP